MTRAFPLRRLTLGLFISLTVSGAACSSGSGAGGSGGETGGNSATGGNTGGSSAGGAGGTSTGGATSSGGGTASGGATGSGGGTASGGATGSGGTTASGGVTGSGGAGGTSSGGAVGSGGATGLGGMAGGKGGATGSGGSAGSAGQATRVRTIIPFDASWLFHYGDATGASATTFADSGWRTISVPHDWSVEGPSPPANPFSQSAATTGRGGYLPSGISWYRKHFTLPQSLSGQKLAVEFDGVMANSDVYVNGVLLGHHPYGYVSFRYDMTANVQFGGADNVVAVKTDTTVQPAERFFAGAGIYRHVRLIGTDAVHVAQYATFVTTPSPTTASATAHVQTTVRNERKRVPERDGPRDRERSFGRGAGAGHDGGADNRGGRFGRLHVRRVRTEPQAVGSDHARTCTSSSPACRWAGPPWTMTSRRSGFAP